MSHRDGDGLIGSGSYAPELSVAVNWVLSEVEWKGVALRRDCGWAVRGLVTAALLWAWSSEAALTERFGRARRVARRLCGKGAPKSTSDQAFIKLLVRWTVRLRAGLVPALWSRREREFPDPFRIAGFVVLAGDGTKVGLARTASNEARFSPAKTQTRCRKPKRRGRRSRSRKVQQRRAREQKADSPQRALTALFHVGLRLLWDWRIGAADSSERDPLREMIADLPPDALITADGGCMGYEFWKMLLDSGRAFVIRVGGRVRIPRGRTCSYSAWAEECGG